MKAGAYTCARWPGKRVGRLARREAKERSKKRRRLPARPTTLPYRRRRALLSRGELAFYQTLFRAVEGRWTINVKPRLADVVWCPPDLWHTSAGARIAQKHLDFVLYDPRTTEIVLAIELDDRSHARPERRDRDAFVDEVLAACGVVLLRVRAAANYDVAAIQSRIEAPLRRGRSRREWL